MLLSLQTFAAYLAQVIAHIKRFKNKALEVGAGRQTHQRQRICVVQAFADPVKAKKRFDFISLKPMYFSKDYATILQECKTRQERRWKITFSVKVPIQLGRH